MWGAVGREIHYLGAGEDRSYHPKCWPVSKAHLTLNSENKEGRGEWGKEEEEGSDPIGGGQYPSGQLCQASHLEVRGEMQIGTWAGRGC